MRVRNNKGKKVPSGRGFCARVRNAGGRYANGERATENFQLPVFAKREVSPAITGAFILVIGFTAPILLDFFCLLDHRLNNARSEDRFPEDQETLQAKERQEAVENRVARSGPYL